jgi:hypothetical protein
MEAAHTQLLLRTEVTWLSRGRVLPRFHELITSSLSQESGLADLLCDETWCTKVAFLADISQGSKKVRSYPLNMPWRAVGLLDVEDPTLSRPGLTNLIHVERQI